MAAKKGFSDALDMHDPPIKLLRLAKRWLEDCSKTHATRSQLISNWYPTRLLEMNAPEYGNCRVVYTTDMTVQEPYMTLSHCWGETQFLKLTTDSRLDLTEGIMVSRLPQTF
jgi:hypothetical protein